MGNKDLQEKAIDIKGRQYVQVSSRIIYFNETYTNGMIRTHLLSKPEDEMVVVKAQVIPDMDKPDRFFVGHSQAKWGEGMVNKTAALENAETSAVGRALAMMGIGVIDSVASVDEMNKAGAVSDGIEYVEGKVCPKDGGKLIVRKTKLGKPYHKCENSKYDSTTKQSSGCDYVDWLNPDPKKIKTVEDYERSIDPNYDFPTEP